MILAADDGAWIWVERFSWVWPIVLTVVGIGAYWLFRPRLMIGFAPQDKVDLQTVRLSLDRECSPRFQAGQELSEPIDIGVACINQGTWTAKDVTFSVFLPEGIEKHMVASKGDGQVDKSLAQRRVYWRSAEPYLHRSQMTRSEFRVRLPKEMIDKLVTGSDGRKALDLDFTCGREQLPGVVGHTYEHRTLKLLIGEGS